MTKIIVLFTKTSVNLGTLDFSKATKLIMFSSYEDMFKWMMKTYHKWVIEEPDDFYIENIEKLLGRKLKPDEVPIYCEQYDDYRE